MKRFILLFFLTSEFIFAHSSSYVLDNGLKLVVKEDHRAPVFISQIYYKVGASDETAGITGVSHMLEHMMFKGTHKYAAGEFSKIIAKNGGQDNAFASKDYTAYYQKMHKDKLAIALELEADRMINLFLQAEDFKTERQVVIEERLLRVEDTPIAQVYEKLSAISYDEKGSYHYPIIGTMQDLQTQKLSDLQKWYKKYYHPNNAIIVVVGDVIPDRVYSLVKKYFGHIKPFKLALNQRKSYPIYSRQASLSLTAKLPFFVMSYPVVSLKTSADDADAYALEVLAYFLGNSDSAHLRKVLMRERKLVSQVSIRYNLYDKYDTSFMISFTPIKGVSTHKVKEIIVAEIEALKTKLISASTLSSIRTQVAADFIYEQDSIENQAYYLGALESVGLGFHVVDEYPQKIAQITRNKLQKTAQKYLSAERLSQVELLPKTL